MAAPKIVIVDSSKRTYASQIPSRSASSVVNYSGSFGATESQETNIDILPVDAYRQVLISVTSASWGTATVAVKIYPCDSQGNTIGTNPLFSFSITSATTTVVILAEMGGTTTVTPWPPASPSSSGAVIGPFGSFLKITEQCTAFTSGTNTVSLEFDLKG